MGISVPECPVEAQLILLFVLSNFIAKVAILLSLAYSVFWVSSWWLTKLFSNAWKMGSSSDLETLILSQRPRLVFKMLLTSSKSLPDYDLASPKSCWKEHFAKLFDIAG